MGESRDASDARALAVGALGLLLTSLVAAGGTPVASEEVVFRVVNGLSGAAWAVLPAIGQLGNLAAVPALAALTGVGRRRGRDAALMAAAGGAAWVAAKLVKELVGRARPDGLLADVVLRGDPQVGPGFPSGHVAVSFAMAAVVSTLLPRRTRWIPWALAALVALSRLYVGAHLPLDLVGGAFLGWMVGTGVRAGSRRLGAAPGPAPRRDRHPVSPRWWRLGRGAASIAVVASVFGFALPRIADYSRVLEAVAGLTWLELATLVGATGLNLATYWPVVVAATPGLSLGQAAVVTQTTTSIANTVPAGGAVAVGMSFAIFRSWGFRPSEIARTALVTGIWNTFVKLGLPVVALALLAAEGDAGMSLLVPALVGVGVLVVSVFLLAGTLWSERLARRIASGLAAAASWGRRILGRGPVTGWAEAAARFRDETAGLLGRRWPALTAATLASHGALYLVLLLALRHVGVSEAEVSAAQVLGVFAFGRLVSAVPVTPGGLGLVELSYVGALVLAGEGRADVAPEQFRGQVAAAVLVFRALTYALQVPIGAATYVVWRRARRWRRAPEPPEPSRSPAPDGVRTPSGGPR